MAKVQYLIQKKKFPFLIYKGRQGTNNMYWKTISYLELNILFPFQIMIFYLLKVFNQIKIYVRQRLVLARFDEINYLILVKFLVHCDKPKTSVSRVTKCIICMYMRFLLEWAVVFGLLFRPLHVSLYMYYEYFFL